MVCVRIYGRGLFDVCLQKLERHRQKQARKVFQSEETEESMNRNQKMHSIFRKGEL